MNEEALRPPEAPRAERGGYRTLHAPLSPAQLAQLACGGLRAEVYGGIVVQLAQLRESQRYEGRGALSDAQIVGIALSLSADAVDAFLADEEARERRRQALPAGGGGT